jgi:hypothetical protein
MPALSAIQRGFGLEICNRRKRLRGAWRGGRSQPMLRKGGLKQEKSRTYPRAHCRRLKQLKLFLRIGMFDLGVPHGEKRDRMAQSCFQAI